jgi:lipoyl(octanoyl) transferase
MSSPAFEIISLPGLTSFQKVYEMQLELLQKRIHDEIPDTFIFCEHASVITRGRGLQPQPDRVEKSSPLPAIPAATEYIEIERGGDLTWHGPGQLVVYPIVKLGGEALIGKTIGPDIEKWIRYLENIWICVLADFGISAATQAGGSGVWVTVESIPTQRKLASVGIALRRWVNFHGIAMNVVNDLAPFLAFDPCGFQSEVMTRLVDFPQIPREYFSADWRPRFEALFVSKIELALTRDQ